MTLSLANQVVTELTLTSPTASSNAIGNAAMVTISPLPGSNPLWTSFSDFTTFSAYFTEEDYPDDYGFGLAFFSNNGGVGLLYVINCTQPSSAESTNVSTAILNAQTQIWGIGQSFFGVGFSTGFNTQTYDATVYDISSLTSSPYTLDILNLTSVGTTATATVASTTGLINGQTFTISGADQAPYNVTNALITVLNGTQFTYTFSGDITSPATGLITATNTAPLATATVASTAGLATGSKVTITGASQASYNVIDIAITVISPTQFTYLFTGDNTSPATGTIIATNVTVDSNNIFYSATQLTGELEALAAALPGINVYMDVIGRSYSPDFLNSNFLTYPPFASQKTQLSKYLSVYFECVPINSGAQQYGDHDAAILGYGCTFSKVNVNGQTFNGITLSGVFPITSGDTDIYGQTYTVFGIMQTFTNAQLNCYYTYNQDTQLNWAWLAATGASGPANISLSSTYLRLLIVQDCNNFMKNNVLNQPYSHNTGAVGRAGLENIFKSYSAIQSYIITDPIIVTPAPVPATLTWSVALIINGIVYNVNIGGTITES